MNSSPGTSQDKQNTARLRFHSSLKVSGKAILNQHTPGETIEGRQSSVDPVEWSLESEYFSLQPPPEDHETVKLKSIDASRIKFFPVFSTPFIFIEQPTTMEFVGCLT